MTTIDSPDIESLIAAGRERHQPNLSIPARCIEDDDRWPCPDRLLIDALVPVYEAAKALWDPWDEPDATPLTARYAALRDALGEPNA